MMPLITKTLWRKSSARACLHSVSLRPKENQNSRVKNPSLGQTQTKPKQGGTKRWLQSSASKLSQRTNRVNLPPKKEPDPPDLTASTPRTVRMSALIPVGRSSWNQRRSTGGNPQGAPAVGRRMEVRQCRVLGDLQQNNILTFLIFAHFKFQMLKFKLTD